MTGGWRQRLEDLDIQVTTWMSRTGFVRINGDRISGVCHPNILFWGWTSLTRGNTSITPVFPRRTYPTLPRLCFEGTKIQLHDVASNDCTATKSLSLGAFPATCGLKKSGGIVGWCYSALGCPVGSEDH